MHQRNNGWLLSFPSTCGYSNMMHGLSNVRQPHSPCAAHVGLTVYIQSGPMPTVSSYLTIPKVDFIMQYI